jgi:hypothetical protein
MGWGDELIASGQAKAMQRFDPRPVLIIDKWGRPRWSDVWNGNPRIARNREGSFQSLLNGPNVRPYISKKTPTHWVWRQFQCEPGELYLTAAEREFAEPYRGAILIEPNVKPKPEAVNKAWHWSRWQDVAYSGIGKMIQVGPAKTRTLADVLLVETPTFRHACAVLSVCRAYVGTEGGLHHAAAAFGVPAVVLFGGFISPDVTGYATHHNLYRGGKACGSRLRCLHCAEAMNAISVEEVAENLQAIL